jgi:hypothetical protein
MTFNNYLPPKTYAFLVKVAEEHKLSVKEVQRIFLNTVAADLGFSCEHLRIGFAKEDPHHNPYCKDCWTRLKMVKAAMYNGKKIVRQGEFWPLETFLDIHYREEAKRKNRQGGSEGLETEERNNSSELIEI